MYAVNTGLLARDQLTGSLNHLVWHSTRQDGLPKFPVLFDCKSKYWKMLISDPIYDCC